MEKLKRLAVGLLPQRLVVVQTLSLLLCSFVIFTSSASAVIRFSDRSLFIPDQTPGATTDYTFSFTYNTATTVGSLDILFCTNPVPTDPCVAPIGLDLSNATLSNQTGETGYNVLLKTSNHLVLTRAPQTVSQTPSTYTLHNVVNPTILYRAFSARLSDYASTDATGVVIDLGSVISNTNQGLQFATQVPPMLIFCAAQQVNLDCSSTSGGNFTDMGALDPTRPLTATSQMAVGTNASGGFVITANGPTMEAGSHEITALASPTVSAPGNSQFGMNLRANTTPSVGNDPDGSSTNAVPAIGYGIPDTFQYRDGDTIASAPNVSLIRRFTISYIVNTPPGVRAGVYTTTITYICSGRF